ncbi:MAG TPA: hypothetical protein VM370_09780 [Candidatus Thermoplasmatota archaeon]|nr:hypothetical protein [Candidatus Thermoplasmatota archaeon]
MDGKVQGLFRVSSSVGLPITVIQGIWLAYAAACVALVGFFFQAPRLSWGSVALAGILIQQALGTVAAVVIYASTDVEVITQAFRSGAYIYMLWGPLVAIAPALLMGKSVDRRIGWALALVGALPTVGLFALNAARPGALFVDFSLTPLATGIFYLTFLAFAATTFVLAREAFTTPAPLRRAQFALLATAFALEGAFHSGQDVVKLILGLDFVGNVTTTLLAIAAAVAFLAIAAWCGRHALRGGTPELRHWARVLLTSILVAAITGAATAPLLNGQEFTDFRGLFHAAWDLVALSLLVFAALRFQLFDIEVRARQGIIVGSVIVLGFVTFATVENVAENFIQSTYLGALPAAGSVAAVFVAATSVFTARLGKVIANHFLPATVTGVIDDEQRRREEIYTAALEGALLDGIVSLAEANSVRRLKQTLGISDADHARLEARVRRELKVTATTSVPTAAPA